MCSTLSPPSEVNVDVDVVDVDVDVDVVDIDVDVDVDVKDGFTKKSCCSFGFCPNQGGGGERALPKFFVTFS